MKVLRVLIVLSDFCVQNCKYNFDFIMSGRSSRKKKNRERDTSRYRSRSRHSRRSPDRRRHGSSHSLRDSPSSLALDSILGRLNAIEGKLSVPSTPSVSIPSRPPRDCQTPPLPAPTPSVNPISSVAEGTVQQISVPAKRPDCLPGREEGFVPPQETRGPVVGDATDRLVGALSSLIQVRSAHYYVSSFDPSVHNFDVWCAEVDRGRIANRWGDRECLSQVGNCLKGDASTWLSDWVTSDRSWSNFKSDFRSLCPPSIDVANILFEVMSTDSSKFNTYAEYARKSFLQLNIVGGLSDDLKTAIVIRGISDPQVKAATSNARLQTNQLVEFLSVYSKPKND